MTLREFSLLCYATNKIVVLDYKTGKVITEEISTPMDLLSVRNKEIGNYEVKSYGVKDGVLEIQCDISSVNNEFYFSLKELYYDGILYLNCGYKIVCTTEDDNSYYDLYDGDKLILCDGEKIICRDKSSEKITVCNENGDLFYLTPKEFDIGVFQ